MPDFSVPVSEYMSTPALTVGGITPLAQAAKLMREHDVSALAVVSADGALGGLLTFTDLLRAGTRRTEADREGNLLDFPANATVSGAMTVDVEAVDASTSCARAAEIMVKKRFHRLPVTRDGALVGILSPFDLMRLIVDQELQTPIADLMSTPLVTLDVEETIGTATERLDSARVSGLVVTEGEWLVGLFTQREALEARTINRDTPVESVMTPAFAALESGTPVCRAAANALALGARRLVVMHDGRPVGIVSSLDVAKVVAS